MKRVTVIIPNYNGITYLKTCLSSLRTQSYKDFSVIVVDNASTDGSTDFIREKYPEVTVIRLDKNYGFCRAINIGIKNADTEFVLLLNNDTKAEKNYIRTLVNAMDRLPHAFSCAPKMLQFHKPELIDDAGNLYNALGWAFAVGKDKDQALYNKEREIFAACAGGSLYRKSAFKKIGYFDEAHFAYLEDIDIGYRSRIYGYRNYYIPKAVVYHVGSGSSGSRYNTFKTSLAARNSIYVVYKNMPFLQLLLNLPFLISGFMIKWVYFSRKNLGTEYAKGIKEGLQIYRLHKKVPFKWKNILNYGKIQFELWINIIKRFL